jgi:hypothetical protein
MTERMRITADFNTMNADPERRVFLPTHVHPHLLEFLRPGLRVVIYEPFDFEVEAVVEYDPAHDAWYGRPDWSTQHSLESDALQRYWDVGHRIERWREAHGDNTPHEATLRKEAEALWKHLTDEERAYLQEGVPRYASYGQARDGQD